MDVLPDKHEEFLQTIRALQGDLEEREGVRESSIALGGEDRNDYRLAIEWATQDDLDKYLQSDVFRILLGALKVLARYSEVKFTSGSRSDDRKLKKT